ncbi:MAG: delta-lactam-biosynthetic de-N-acetylase [Oscillospiraceae bacterium]|jgi:peptidoglycan-N-acetylmuramic acid deacetylase
MKRLVLIGLVLALSISFTACDNGKNNDSSSSGSGNSNSLSGDISDGISDLEPSSSDSSESSSSDSAPSSQTANTKPADLDTAVLSSLDNTKKGWGQGVNKDECNRPTGCLQYQDLYGKYDAYFIEKQEKVIYLTFDEGYENGYTSQILDTLKEKECPAVFFVTYDYVNRNPDLVQRMIDEGHVVGNHSRSHPSMPTVSIDEAKDEIMKLHEFVKTSFDYEMTLFRPPMGEFSERTLALTQQLGYKSIFWSYAYADWDPDNQIGAEQAYEKVTSAEHEGAIYLLHAVSRDNAEILGRVIDDMRANGYTLKALA